MVSADVPWYSSPALLTSAFRHMHAERDHLATVVFPELCERVGQLGLEFFDLDRFDCRSWIADFIMAE